nr:transposon Ty3-I Gag-Pol polyprotein [Tanacetum cinerariifolium]
MSSPNHPTSNIEDAFSSNFLDYTTALPNYFPASPRNISSDPPVKIEHQRACGLLQQLDIPVWKWDEISMDFVTGLPQTQRRHDAIWVVMDRLTKSAHFLPIRKDYSVSRLAKIFQQEIVRLHATPSAIVFRPFKTLCFFNYALMIRQDYDITSSLRRGALQ